MVKSGKIRYRVKIECHDDIMGKTWNPGEIVTDNTFPKSAIQNFLEIGVLEILPEESVTDGEPGQEQTFTVP